MVDRVAAPAAATARAPRPPLARKEAPAAMAPAPHADLPGMCPPRPRRGCGTSTRSRPSPWDPPRDSPTRPPAASTRPARPRTRNKSANAKISAITTSPNCNRIPPPPSRTNSARRRRHKTSTSNPLQPHRHHRASRGRLTRRRRGSCESPRCFKPEASLFYFSYGQSETDVVFCSTSTLTGRTKEALAAVDAALRLRPNDLNAITKHGLCFQALGALHDAYNAYDSVIRVQPNHPLACRALGTLFQVRSLF